MLTTPNFYTGRRGVKKVVCTPFQHIREAQAANPGLEPKDRVAGRGMEMCHVWLVCVTVSLRCAISHVYTAVCRDPLRDTARPSARLRHETERSCTECRALPFQVKAVGTVTKLKRCNMRCNNRIPPKLPYIVVKLFGLTTWPVRRELRLQK